MSARNLFEELKQGLEEIHQHIQGKITLKTDTLAKQNEAKPPSGIIVKNGRTIPTGI